MKMARKFAAVMAAAAMVTATMTTVSVSASVDTRTAYMLGDVHNDLYVNSSDAAMIMSALSNHGFERGNRVNVTYVQNHLSDWFPQAVCAKAADANEDGYISYDDADDILQYSANVGAGNGGYKNIGKLYLYTD